LHLGSCASSKHSVSTAHANPISRSSTHNHKILAPDGFWHRPRQGQIAIARGAFPTSTPRGFLPWGLSDDGPSACPTVAMGRRPKPFTIAEVWLTTEISLTARACNRRPTRPDALRGPHGVLQNSRCYNKLPMRDHPPTPARSRTVSIARWFGVFPLHRVRDLCSPDLFRNLELSARRHSTDCFSSSPRSLIRLCITTS